jgi:hypothetical protein
LKLPITNFHSVGFDLAGADIYQRSYNRSAFQAAMAVMSLSVGQ